jgi:3'-5' exoribonuclease
MRFIKDLKEGERIGEIYLCRKKQSALTKAGKPYESLTLQDKTGTLDAKIWEPGSMGIDDFEELDYIHVTGDVTSFQGANQLNIKRLRVAAEGEYVPEDYLPCSTRDLDEMYRELMGLINTVKAPYFRQLLKKFFENEEFAGRFSHHSAAKSVHHGFVGGLLEHTLGVANVCNFFAEMYPILDRDLLLTAAIFHDIGKLDELSAFPQNDYTDAGQLLGHIMIGVHHVEKGMEGIDGFPEIKKRELLHCILSHHGELEFGSPKKPAIAEAVALSFADNMDAKMETLKEALADVAASDTKWQGYNRLFESNIRRTSPQDL